MPRSSSAAPNLKQFIPGSENTLTWRAVQSLVEEPAGLPAPVVFHGPPGCGKSHLLAGMATAMRREHPGLSQRHVTADQLTRRVQASHQHRSTGELSVELGTLDLLIVDDLQRLATRRATQRLLCGTLDRILESGGQVICAAKDQPRQIEGLSASLSNRLHQGLLMRVDPASTDTRTSLLRRHLIGAGLTLTAAQQAAIVAKVTNPDRLVLLVEVLGRLASQGQAVNRVVIEEALEQLGARGPGDGKSLEAIVSLVERDVRAPAGSLVRRGGPRSQARARRMAILLCHEQSHPRPLIADHFALRPGSVSAAVRQARRELVEDEVWAERLDALRSELERP